MAQAGKTKKVFDGRYEILGIVGRGACSVVYHARYLSAPSSELAIKVLVNRKGLGPNTDRLRKEALAMVSARHRYVIRLDDFHAVDALCYLSMEFAPESDLRAYIKKIGGRLPTLQAERFLLQMAEATAFMHQTGIVHRDIKPDNILIINPRQARLGDFGVAVLPGEAPSLEELQKGIGTMDYMAPEVFEGKPCDPRSDVYALALSFYEVLAGFNPFTNIPLAQVLEARKDHNLPHLQEVAPETSAPLSEVLMRALAYDPARRFQNGQEFLKALLIAKSKEGAETESRKPATPATSTKLSTKVVEFQTQKSKKEKRGSESSSPAAHPSTPPPKAEESRDLALKKKKRRRRKVKAKSSTTVSLLDQQGPAASIAETTQIPPVMGRTREAEASPPFRRIMPRPTAVPFTPSSAPAGVEKTAQVPGHIPTNAPLHDNASAGMCSETTSSLDNQKQAQDNKPHLRDFTKGSATPFEADNTADMMRRAAFPATRPLKARISKLGFGAILALLIAVFSIDFALKKFTQRGIAQRTLEMSGFSDDTALIPKVTSFDFEFPSLPAGLYSGTITDLIPGETLPFAIIALAEQNRLVFLAGIEGWRPPAVTPADVDNGRVRLRTDGFVLLLSAHNVGGELIGEFSNLITNGTGTWQVKPVK